MTLNSQDNPELLIDLWIIDKFGVLPTDKRFLDLYEEQKVAMFEGVMGLGEQSVLKKHFILNKKVEEIKNKKEDEFISIGLQRKMMENLSSSGMNKEQIRKRIKAIIDSKRQMELKKIEDLKNE